MAINRKDFLKTMGGLAALTIIPRRVLGGPGHIAPNDQLTKGIIGMGGIGFSANHFSSNEQCRLVAVCDCDDNHLQKGVRLSKERLNEEVKGYHLYRDLINDPNVDVVHIATPPH
ncbi:MAG: gfo/Idh/MocA family oxidoreductase, partial [Alistipes sp.]|nr:gfo/Idh/MocA family oxidoreductase [Alistipes sp.]